MPLAKVPLNPARSNSEPLRACRAPTCATSHGPLGVHPLPTPGAPCPTPQWLGACRLCPSLEPSTVLGHISNDKQRVCARCPCPPRGPCHPCQLRQRQLAGQRQPELLGVRSAGVHRSLSSDLCPSHRLFVSLGPSKPWDPPGPLGAAAQATCFQEINDIITVCPGPPCYICYSEKATASPWLAGDCHPRCVTLAGTDRRDVSCTI